MWEFRFLPPKSLFLQHLLLAENNHTGNLLVATRCRSRSIWNFEAKQLRVTFFYSRNNIPYELEMNEGSAEIQFVSFIFLLSGKLSNHHIISLGLNSTCHPVFFFFFSQLKSVRPRVKEHRLHCVISERLWIQDWRLALYLVILPI